MSARRNRKSDRKAPIDFVSVKSKGLLIKPQTIDVEIIEDYLNSVSLSDQEIFESNAQASSVSPDLQPDFFERADTKIVDDAAFEEITYESVNIREIHRSIKAFVRDDEETQLALDPMDYAVRRRVEAICELYKLNISTCGISRALFLHLTKTSKTKFPQSFKKLDRLLNTPLDKSHAKGNPASEKSIRKKERSEKTAAKKKSVQHKPLEGSAVAEHVSPIAQSNVGRQMLEKLGWKLGDSLGSSQNGIKDPVCAIFKANKKGLGM